MTPLSMNMLCLQQALQRRCGMTVVHAKKEIMKKSRRKMLGDLVDTDTALEFQEETGSQSSPLFSILYYTSF